MLLIRVESQPLSRRSSEASFGENARNEPMLSHISSRASSLAISPLSFPSTSVDCCHSWALRELILLEPQPQPYLPVQTPLAPVFDQMPCQRASSEIWLIEFGW